MRRYHRFCTRLAALAVAATIGLVGCSRAEDDARELLDEFLAGWVSGDLDGVPFVDPVGKPVRSADVSEQIGALSGGLRDESPELTVADLAVNEGLGTARVSVAWPLPGGATWDYDTTVRLTDGDGGWRVIWAPEVVHPELLAGDELRLRRDQAPRGAILDGTGNPIMAYRPVQDIGVWPSRVTDADALVAELEAAFQTIDLDLADTLAELPDKIEEAREDDHRVPVVTLRDDDYAQVADALSGMDEILVDDDEWYLAPTRGFAQALLGGVGQVTAEIMDENPGAYVETDRAGLGGLSREYDEPLRGVPGHRVVIARDNLQLAQVEPVPGDDLTLTLDIGVQEAAEAALSAESKPAALVAIRISDGAVLAVANTEGDRPYPVNTALTGAIAPGSTFKPVSAYGLLDAGEVTLDAPVACPAEFTVGGHEIGNDFSGDRGEIPFREAVAISCNTAFAALAPRLGDDGLATAAAALGLGGDWDLGTATFTGNVSTGGSDSALAQAAFGQGDTQVSPVAMAAATAAIARGAWLPPTLVVDPAAATPDPVPLNESAAADVQTAMRAVVTGGTGRDLAGTPGGDVYGKTGSAEAGPDVTHGWFVGWQGDLAVAVFVEDGGSGSGAAVPLADRFLRALAA